MKPTCFVKTTNPPAGGELGEAKHGPYLLRLLRQLGAYANASAE